MEFDFENDEFESFLKQKADQYKMYPSEKAWKGISFVLHSRNRLITIGGSLLLISVFFFFGGRFLTTQGVSSAKPAETRIITKFSSVASSNLLPVSAENARKSVVAATGIALKNKVLESPVSTPAPKAAPHKISFPKRESDISKGLSVEVADLTAKELSLQSAEKEVTPSPSATMLADDNPPSTPDLANTSVSNEPPKIYSEEAAGKSVNWLQEIAAIKLSSPRKNPFNIQFYFSPMVSYRRLVDNNAFKGLSSSGNAFSSSSSSVDRMVDHKPSIGVEIGSNLIYSAGRNLTIKSGIQLNYSRYTIKAYKSYIEKASIALNSVGQRSLDTITSYTNVRNFNGYSSEVLENQYLQVSVPVGAELVLLGKKKLQFSIAGTVQPTYLIFNDAYLLTTDYVHYTKEPSLVRKWNVHTSAEAFISYRSGSVKWQVGPQFRYQLMSSYTDRYPIKEYLIEYGIKFGISKTLK